MGVTSQASGVPGVGQIAPYRMAQIQSGGEVSTYGETQEFKKVTGDTFAETQEFKKVTGHLVRDMEQLKEELSGALLLIGVAAISTLVISQVVKFLWRGVFQLYTTR